MSNQSHIHIATGADQRYFPGLLCSITTALLFASKTESIVFYIFDGGINAESKSKLESICQLIYPKVSINWLSPELEQFQGLVSMSGNFMCYARLYLPEILQIDRAIWLDSDLLVFEDIKKLWETKIYDYPIAASLEDCPIGSDVKNSEEFNIPQDSPYYNTGVLIMDFKQLRESSFAKSAVEYLKGNHGKYLWYDQSAINVVLHQQIFQLDRKWNYLNRIFDSSPDLDLILDGRYIYHFLQRPKPWQKYSETPHALLLYDILSVLECPMPELSVSNELKEKAKWLFPSLTHTIYSFRHKLVLSGDKCSDSIACAWKRNAKFKRLNRDLRFRKYRQKVKSKLSERISTESSK